MSTSSANVQRHETSLQHFVKYTESSMGEQDDENISCLHQIWWQLRNVGIQFREKYTFCFGRYR